MHDLPASDDPLWREAQRIHQSAIVIDGHNDVAGVMAREGFDLTSDGVGRTDTDLVRLKAGGVTGQFFAVFVYIDPQENPPPSPIRPALERIDAVHRLVEQNPDHFLLATDADAVRRAKAEGKIAALLGVEGGYQIDDSLAVLRNFYRLGVRYLTLTWLHSHSWADSSGNPFVAEIDPALVRHGGLSDFGKDVLREMNRLGMLIDISHVSDDVVRDALAVSRAPLIASHSNARTLADIPRNLSDDLARAIAAEGGVLMVNFASEYMSLAGLQAKIDWNVHLAQKTAELKEQFPNNEDNGQTLGLRRLRFSPDRPAGPLSLLVDHIDHLVQTAGIDHIGLGSDFDGGIIPPLGLDDVSQLPNLTHALLQRGYDETAIRKVLGENFLRVFAQAETGSGCDRLGFPFSRRLPPA